MLVVGLQLSYSLLQLLHLLLMSAAHLADCCLEVVLVIIESVDLLFVLCLYGDRLVFIICDAVFHLRDLLPCIL